MQIIRFQGWKVNTETWKTFLIEDFHTHNLLVILFALSSQLVETFNILLSNIQDPFMRFIEFNLRSAIYRNIILSIEVSVELTRTSWHSPLKLTTKYSKQKRILPQICLLLTSGGQHFQSGPKRCLVITSKTRKSTII